MRAITRYPGRAITVGNPTGHVRHRTLTRKTDPPAFVAPQEITSEKWAREMRWRMRMRAATEVRGRRHSCGAHRRWRRVRARTRAERLLERQERLGGRQGSQMAVWGGRWLPEDDSSLPIDAHPLACFVAALGAQVQPIGAQSHCGARAHGGPSAATARTARADGG